MTLCRSNVDIQLSPVGALSPHKLSHFICSLSSVSHFMRGHLSYLIKEEVISAQEKNFYGGQLKQVDRVQLVISQTKVQNENESCLERSA